MADGRGSTGNIIAALCSVFVPGLGQLLQVKLMKAALMFLSVTVLYAISPYLLFLPLIPGALIHLWSIVDAATFKR